VATVETERLAGPSVFSFWGLKDTVRRVERHVVTFATFIMSEKLKEFVEIPTELVKDGRQFLTRCTKPSQKEFVQICKAVAIGFAVMGFIGYFVKLIHIPINNILVGGA